MYAYYTLNNSLYDIDIVADSKVYFPSNSDSLFSNLIHVLSLNFNDSIDTSNVTDMEGMFRYCFALTEIDVSYFDTSNVTNMYAMFANTGYNSTAFTLDVSNFDTSNVTNMSYMFYFAGHNSTNLNTSITILNPNVTSYTSMFNGVATKTGSQITVNYTAETESLVDAMIATKSSTSNVVKGSLINTITPTINTANIVAVPASAYPNTKVALSSTVSNMVVTSFKLNGTLVDGDTFAMPSTGAVITDVTTVEGLIVETSHNPYEDNINNVIYGEKTFSGATSLKVILDYQTQGVSSDWLYIYGANSYKSEKYGGTTRTSKVITIPGNYIKFEFKSNGSSNNYYGFKATVIPIY